MKDSKYYAYYKAKAPLTVKELNNSSVKLVRYDEGWQEVECPEYEGQSEYKYCWAMPDVSMKTLADLETKEDSAFGYVSHLVSEIRKAAKVYRKEAASAHKERRPVRITNELREAWADAMCVIEQHNKRRINEHPGYVALKRMAWVNDENLKADLEDYQCRYKSLKDADMNGVLMSQEELNNLPEHEREMWLDKAADLGVIPKEQKFMSKTPYTFRAASISDPLEEGDLYWLRPYNQYHEATDEDPIVSCVGKYRKTVVTQAEENEIIALAMYMTNYFGDEFVEKVEVWNKDYEVIVPSFHETPVLKALLELAYAKPKTITWAESDSIFSKVHTFPDYSNILSDIDYKYPELSKDLQVLAKSNELCAQTNVFVGLYEKLLDASLSELTRTDIKAIQSMALQLFKQFVACRETTQVVSASEDFVRLVPKSEVRLGLYEEFELERRDFSYEGNDIDRAIEDDSNMFEDVLDDMSEEKVEEEDCPIEDELDFMNGTEL